ncbi:MAG TPA: MFS transporter [Bacteroidales bacterium]|nr:MFS transporter [Bacteroidales bacterium]
MQNWKKTFITIWAGQLISILTSSVVAYAVVFWLSVETGSAEILAVAAMAAMLPQALLGLFTGVYIDRWNRKLIMIISDSFIACATLGLVVLFYFGKAEIWHIYTLLAARSVGQAFHLPAMQASIPLIAPEDQLMRIAGVNQMIQSVSGIAGPAIGALLITLFDMKWVLMLDVFGALFAVVTLMLVFIPDPDKTGESQSPHVFREIRDGLHEIYRDRGLYWLFVFSVIATFFIMPVAVLFPLMTLNHFGGSVIQMSIVEILWGLGMLAGGALVGVKNFKGNKALMINYMYFIFGMTFLLSGLLPSSAFVWFVILTGIGGVSAAIYNASFMSLIQIKINPSMLGRVFSTYTSFTLFPAMVGLLGIGFVADKIGLINAFIICGAINLALGFISFMIPAIKRTGE